MSLVDPHVLFLVEISPMSMMDVIVQKLASMGVQCNAQANHQ